MTARVLHHLSSLRAATARLFHGRPYLAAGLAVAMALGSWCAAGWAAWFTADVVLQLPGRDAVRDIGDMAQSTTLYDVQDRPVFTIFREQRLEVPLARVSPTFLKAVIAIEDQRFYDHRGVDVIRVGAAVLANLRSGRRAQGGSTITQQLARQSFLTRDKTFRRKVKEMLLAAEIEHNYSKDAILELYLNKVYFGDGYHGVEAAALGYFGKHASELDVPEAALLAGLIQSPSAYAPTGNLARAVARRNVVLGAMRAARAIDEATFRAALDTKVSLKNGLQRDEPYGQYFKELVRRELVERFGWERVSEGGLRVYTTIDANLQPRVEVLVEESLQEIERRRGFAGAPRKSLLPIGDENPDYLQAAVVSIDVATGEVRALVGGRNFKESRFNRAVQAKRQAGSAFKPFVYAAALEGGMTPASLVTSLDDPVLTAQGEWMPEDEHSSAEAMTLRTALRTSSNRAAVQVLRTVGIGKAVDYIQHFELGNVPAVPSMALGAGEVTLTAMTAAYGTFASGGVLHKPILIRRVEDGEGNVIYRARSTAQQVVTPVTAFLLSNMLADVINAGTAWKARAAGFTLPAAGKTGTTNEYRDAWFVGFTPRVVTGVWIGFDQPKPIVPNGYAGEVAVPLWARVMNVATKGDEPKWLERPPGVVAAQVCRVSGKLPDEGCSSVEVIRDNGEIQTRSMVYTEYFVRGTAPTTICPLHPSRSWVDRVAGVFGGGDDKRPVRADEIGLPPASAPPSAATESGKAAATSAAAAPEKKETAEGEEKPKKRGFWSRIFGRRDKDDTDAKKESEQKKKPDEKRPPGPPQ